MAATNAAAEKPDVVMIENSVRDDLEDNPEKAPQVLHVDGFNVLGLTPDDADFYQNYSLKDRKKTTHKVDVRLVPMLAVGSDVTTFIKQWLIQQGTLPHRTLGQVQHWQHQNRRH